MLTSDKQYYRIVSQLNNKCISVPAAKHQVITSMLSFSQNQHFLIEECSGDTFVVVSRVTGNVLDVCNESKKDGAEVLDYGFSNRKNQIWRLREGGQAGEHKYWFIENVGSGKVLEIEGGVDADGVGIIQNTNHGHRNQLWRFERV